MTGGKGKAGAKEMPRGASQKTALAPADSLRGTKSDVMFDRKSDFI